MYDQFTLNMFVYLFVFPKKIEDNQSAQIIMIIKHRQSF